jgi:hypothetical protein
VTTSFRLCRWRGSLRRRSASAAGSRPDHGTGVANGLNVSQLVGEGMAFRKLSATNALRAELIRRSASVNALP